MTFSNSAKLLVASLVLGAALSGCDNSSYYNKNDGALNGSAITREFPGHTLIGGIRHEAGAWATYVRPDGVSLFRTPAGEILETQWAVTGDRFCYADVGGLDKICFRVFKDGKGYQFIDENGKESVYAIKKDVGDTLDLTGFLNSQRILRVRRQQELDQDALRTSRTLN